jgi:hypothetical protein
MVDRFMSSLPPYNPPPTRRRLWLLSSVGSAAQREPLLASTGVTEVIETGEAEGLIDRVRRLETDVVVVAPEAVLEGLILELVGGRQGTARVRFLPRCLTQVQMLDDQAVVRHLNIGAPLWK